MGPRLISGCVPAHSLCTVAARATAHALRVIYESLLILCSEPLDTFTPSYQWCGQFRGGKGEISGTVRLK